MQSGVNFEKPVRSLRKLVQEQETALSLGLPEPRCQEKTNTGEGEFLKQDLRGSVLQTDEGRSDMRVETENVGNEGFSGSSLSSSAHESFVLNSVGSNTTQQTCRIKHLCESRVSRKDHSFSHGGQLSLQDNQVGARRHEAPLSHDQGRVCGRTQGIRDEDPISEHRSAGATHTGERASHSGGPIPARGAQNDVMKKIAQAKKDELKEMCISRGLNVSQNPTVGEMRLRTRVSVIDQGTNDTVMEIGKHAGIVF